MANFKNQVILYYVFKCLLKLSVSLNISEGEDEEEQQNDQINNQDENHDNSEDEDEVVKAIKAEKNKLRDHPPSIKCDDFIVDISFHPFKNIIALANIVGDVMLYEYSNDETKLVNTLELHTKACRDVEFDNEGFVMFTTAKVSSLFTISLLYLY